MSVLVKGMRMPKSCSYCDFYNMHLVRCTRIPKWLEIDVCNYRDKECPLVEVPAPHGRLIDAETKIEAQYYDEEYEEWTMQTFTVEDIISIADNEVPTVIEAEVME